MKIYLERDRSENGIATIRNLIACLQLQVTEELQNQLNDYPDYPSIAAISDFLLDIQVDSMAVKLEPQQLSEIPLPSILHLERNGGHFVVMKKIEKEGITYIDSELGLIKESISTFLPKWTGFALLVQANGSSGEVDYISKTNGQKKMKTFKRVQVFIFGLILVIPLLFLPPAQLPFYILSSFGIITCLFLVQKQFGFKNSYTDKLCSVSAESNCDTVINSKASRFFHFLYLSEIGLLYFVGNTIILINTGLFQMGFSIIFAFQSLLLLPCMLYSVYYQWKVVKTWCPLCLAVALILLLQCFSLLLISDYSWSYSIMGVAVFWFLFPILFWFSIRQTFVESVELIKLKKRANRIAKNTQIFKTLLDRQAPLVIPNSHAHVSQEITSPKIELTLVSSPTCGPCIQAHRVINRLMARYPNQLKVNFKFLVHPNEKNSTAYKVAAHLIALKDSGDDKIMDAMSSWYLSSTKDFEKWTKSFPIKSAIDQSLIDEKIQSVYIWSSQAEVTNTPSVFIKNRRLPVEYGIEDLEYHINRMIATE